MADLNTARGQLGGSGATYTAAIAAGGGTPSATAVTEILNGSSWTEVNDLNNSRRNLPVSGTTTAAIAGGGEDGPNARIESWDGSSWTEIAEANTSRNSASMSCNGSNTATIYFGGYTTDYVANTEDWNGSAWTEVNDLSTAKGYAAGTGTSTLAFSFGGNPAPISTTEEWSAPAEFNQIQEGQLFFNSTANTFKETIKDSAAGTWASGGTMNQARLYSLIYSVSGGPSGQSDAFAISGANPASTNLANVESYNGTAWTETTDVNTARRLGGGCGGQPAAVVAGGYTTGDVANTEVWNGSSWTETGDLNSAKRQFAGSFGTPDSSSDLLVSGAFPRTANVEIWDGSSWTETSNLNQSRSDGAGIGVSSTAGLVAGGQSSPSPIPGQTAYAENWNGSSWTEVAEFNTNRMNLAAAGEQTSGLLMGGNTDPGNSTTTEIWNGSSWTELNDLSTGVAANSGGGSSVAAISFGGSTPTITGASEEFTAALANKTITAS